MTTMNELKSQVEQVLIASQAYPFDHLELDELMNSWQKNKAPYIELFGGEIYKVPTKCTITLSKEMKQQKFQDMINTFVEEVDVNSTADNGLSFYDFLQENKETFFDNVVNISHPEIKIKEGMKLLKCFKYFLPSFTTIRYAQDLASRFIQSNKIEGYIYLSVHPLDFLSLSETNSNWRSCHSLDGDFRAGNLSYMADKTTIIAYLADDTLEQLQAFPKGLLWNDKQWRMLLHTNNFESVIYYNRQYPFDNKDLMRIVWITINQLLPKSWFTYPNESGFSDIRIKSWAELLSLDHNFILGQEDCIYDTRDTINDSDFPGYCDLIYSSHYSPIISLKPNNEYLQAVAKIPVKEKYLWDQAFHQVYDIKIGEPVHCVRCGKGYIQKNHSFLCQDCIALEDADEDFFLVCETCGSRIYNLNDAVVLDGHYYCTSCADILPFNEEDEENG